MIRGAHIVGTTSISAALDWAAAAVVMVIGAVGIFAARGRELRSAGLLAALLGASATVTPWVVAGSAPSSPGYRLRIAAPAQDASVTSPVTLELCGTDLAGHGAAVPVATAWSRSPSTERRPSSGRRRRWR